MLQRHDGAWSGVEEQDELQVLVHGAPNVRERTHTHSPAWVDAQDASSDHDDSDDEPDACKRHSYYTRMRSALAGAPGHGKGAGSGPSKGAQHRGNHEPSRHRQRPRQAHWGMMKTLVTAAVFVGLCLAGFVAYWVAWFVTLRHDAVSHSVFSKPLEPRGHAVDHLASPFASPAGHAGDGPLSIDSVQSVLDDRWRQMQLEPSDLHCSISSDDQAKYERDLALKQEPVLFAINLYNSQHVIPSISRALLQAANVLGRDNVHVSVFENGSTDNTTTALAHFAAALTAADVRHTVLSDPRATDWNKVDRIAQLALYRNYVLQPVNSSDSTHRPFEHVVFVNDVYMCGRDVLELLWQRKHQQADAACAMDWRASKSPMTWLGRPKGVKFYDNWVSRDLNGNMLRPRMDIFAELRDGVRELFDRPGAEAYRERFLHGLPVPVYSCWNGMLALPAAPFRATPNRPATLFRSAFNKPGQCAASECKILARDFWAQGLRRWFIVPSVHVTYDRETYDHSSLVDLKHKSAATPPTHLSSDIVWDDWSPPESVVCWAYVKGLSLDFPWLAARNPPWR
ncbi:hypothetical protein OIV83_001249 [Microbotryomycetes sp. JL201]|nr:hypothetical protein OIV83_001249 [Microbotryomycetes sp. JL201]